MVWICFIRSHVPGTQRCILLLLCEDGVHEHFNKVWFWRFMSTKREVGDNLHEELTTALLYAAKGLGSN